MAALHVTLVMLTGLIVLYSDEQGFLWLLGKKPLLSHRQIELQHVLVSIGLAGIILTGGLMFVDRASYLIHDPVFLAKMAFVLALVVNGFFIGSVSELAAKKTYKELSGAERGKVLASGAVSVISWIGAGLLGLLLG
ncbi:MAG TPA: hypothetical protein VGN56_00995 [Candidatus Paceibacterota bacterium]|jgi:hypothetical protein|nr:hypothetical protein [Candidatus Paceibacterota bacterium]